MCVGGGGGDNGAQQARADETARQARITAGNAAIDKNFARFGEPFFKSRQQAYVANAAPQLATQYDQTSRNLAYNLARSGLTSSSEASRNVGELQRQFNTGQSQIANAGLDYANQARTNIEQQKAELRSQLNATGDAQAVGNAALNRASVAANQANSFSPIGNLFQDTTGLLGNAYRAGVYNPNASGLNAYRNIFSSAGKARVVGT